MWTKSQHSNPYGNCVEVTSLHSGSIGVRNSRDSAGSFLVFTKDEIKAFFAGVRDGEFDYLFVD
jgi:Domain of unknown function (DUF397)